MITDDAKAALRDLPAQVQWAVDNLLGVKGRAHSSVELLAAHKLMELRRLLDPARYASIDGWKKFSKKA